MWRWLKCSLSSRHSLFNMAPRWTDTVPVRCTDVLMVAPCCEAPSGQHGFACHVGFLALDESVSVDYGLKDADSNVASFNSGCFAPYQTSICPCIHCYLLWCCMLVKIHFHFWRSSNHMSYRLGVVGIPICVWTQPFLNHVMSYSRVIISMGHPGLRSTLSCWDTF